MMIMDRAEWKAGWRTVLGAALATGTSIGLYQYVSSLFLDAIRDAEGGTRGQITLMAGVGLLGFVFAPLLGMAADRFGVRRMASVFTLAMTCGWVLLATLPFHVVTYTTVFAFTAYFGLGAGSLVYACAVVGWFQRSRGVALGLAATGVSLYAIATPPILHDIIQAHGWRAGFLLLAALTVIFGMPALWLLVHENPHAAPRKGANAHGLPLLEALKQKPVWILAFMIGVVNFASTGILSQLTPILTDKGFSS
jgi:MFS family permease